jgi:hypothetical protein
MVDLHMQWPYSVYCDTASVEVRAFILLALRRSVVKEVSLFIQDLPSHNHVNVELYGAFRIVTYIGKCTTSLYGARFGLWRLCNWVTASIQHCWIKPKDIYIDKY